MISHELDVKAPHWETKLICTCGERCVNWMEFYRHRGDQYLAQLQDKNSKMESLLDLAHNVITWADQCWEGIEKTAGGKHYKPKQKAYFKARIDLYAPLRPLNPNDLGPFYYEGAAKQPWNHRIPWNCKTYHDGCNCEGGPFYDKPSKQ